MAEDKKKPDEENPFSEEMPSVTRLLNRKSLKTGQTSPGTPAPVKPAAAPATKSAAPAATKPAGPPKVVTLTGITKPGAKPPTPPPAAPKKPPPGGSGTKK